MASRLGAEPAPPETASHRFPAPACHISGLSAVVTCVRATKGGEVGTKEPWSPDGLRRLGDLYEPLRRFAAVVGKWDVEPDDLVQEAHTKVLARPEDGIDDLGPYLRRAIVNAATDERRRDRQSRRARRRADLVVRAGFRPLPRLVSERARGPAAARAAHARAALPRRGRRAAHRGRSRSARHDPRDRARRAGAAHAAACGWS